MIANDLAAFLTSKYFDRSAPADDMELSQQDKDETTWGEAEAEVLDPASDSYYLNKQNMFESIIECKPDFETKFMTLLNQNDGEELIKLIKANSKKYWMNHEFLISTK